MAVQFQSAQPSRPYPFVATNPSRQTLLSDLGEALTAVGNIPAQMQANQIRDQLNKLLLTSLSAPMTQQQQITTPGSVQPDVEFGLPPTDQMFLNAPKPTSGDLGSMLTEPTTTTKTVPGQDYKEATGRLGDVGYAGGGFNFRPRTGLTLEEQKLLDQAKGETKIKVQEKAQEGRTGGQLEVEKAKQEGAMARLEKNIQDKQKRAAEHEANVREIATDNNLNDQQKIDKILKERALKRKSDEENYRDRTQAIRAGITNTADLKKSNEINKWFDDLVKVRTQIDKINQKSNQSDPETAGLKAQSVEQYNALVDKIKSLDPNANVSKMTEMDDPTGVLNYIRGIGAAVAPGLINPPGKKAVPAPAGSAPKTTTPATPITPGVETPEQKAARQKQIIDQLNQRMGR